MHKLINMTLNDYINEVDSELPAPGGGSVMGLVGSLACALAGMVGHLTVGKNEFMTLNEEEQKSFNDVLENIKNIKLKLMEMVDKDALVFNAFMYAMKMPKNTLEDKNKRKEAISNAAIMAIDIPFTILESCYKLIPLFDIVLKYGNSNVVSDIAISYILSFASAKGSILNININIPFICDETYINNIKSISMKYIKFIESRYYELEKELNLFNI